MQRLVPLFFETCYRRTMLFHEPSPPAVRLVQNIIALSLVGLTMSGCERQAPDPAPENVQAEAAPEPRSVPAPLPLLTRADLISAAGQAASNYAGGSRQSGSDPLVGRTFSVKIAFGCSGPTLSSPEGDYASGLAGWSWGTEGKTIELKMTPGDWTGSALIAGGADAPDWEAVEGFWLPRPWLATEGCPTVRRDPLQTANVGAAPQTVGLAAIFEAGGSRVGRRNGRAYTVTIRPESDVPVQPSASGYRLILEGRIGSYPDARAIRCRATGPDHRPVCVVAAKLDRVAFEMPDGKMLSEWRSG